MITEVVKGVDDEIEFRGFRGRYFYFLAGSVVGLVVVTFLLYAVGLHSFFLLSFALAAGVGAYLYLKTQMATYGKYGHIHRAHRPPAYILHNRPFYQFIPKK